ncbi:hypothetical protein [Sediminicurvatus halobius]|uniref:Uncharacterized protein n=1 Tax=Sediminicurvatus halobius TaxID=2182432 RepID=A0A2U2MYD6_9GAMM|nr:hypothetical protein [Spiribacter halobius]PWG61900.1 hypothetical protein DEM34_14320 [Spiribacter halobius]UEX79225.1 hypothetical protein LMH63_06200 [Spiribacter halobius]
MAAVAQDLRNEDDSMSNVDAIRESIVSTITRTARFRREMAAAPANRQDVYISAAAAALLEALADHVRRSPENSEISSALAGLESADGDRCRQALKQASDYVNRVGFTELVDAPGACRGLARTIRRNPGAAEHAERN